VVLSRNFVVINRKARVRHKLNFTKVFGRKRRREPREERTCRVLQSLI